MNSSYDYPTSKNLKVTDLLDTEPALNLLFHARRAIKERGKEFNPAKLSEKEIPKYINSICEEIHFRLTALRHQLYEIGRLLCEVKSLLPHGRFNLWIEENFPFSKATAGNFMNVYTACMGCPELVEYFKPSVLYEIVAPRFKKDLREELFIHAEATGVYPISKKQLLEVSMKWRKGLINKDSAEFKSLLKQEKDKTYWTRYEIQFSALESVLKIFKKKFEALNDRHIAFR